MTKKNNAIQINLSSNGDAHLKLTKIKVKDYEGWSRESQEPSAERMKVIQEKVNVTFYRMKQFQETFTEIFGNYDQIYDSLHPSFN